MATTPAADSSISPPLAEFLESGLIMHLATRSADLKPVSTLASGVRVEAPDRVTVFLAEVLGAEVLANLADNGEMALTLVRVTDNRSIQLKGTLLGRAPATEADRLFQVSYRERLIPEMGMVGLPHSVTARLVIWPSSALLMQVRDLFVQTPGLDAGRRLEPGAASLLRTTP